MHSPILARVVIGNSSMPDWNATCVPVEIVRNLSQFAWFNPCDQLTLANN
jgi:hypothetical protein